MGTKKLTVVMAHDPTTESITEAKHRDMTKESAYGDIDRDHMATAASVATISAASLSAPKTGELRVDTSTSPHTLRAFDGSAERATAVDYASAQPSTTVAGALWWDRTLSLIRIYDTRDSITGWHPLDPGYSLRKNTGFASATMPVGTVVVSNGGRELELSSGTKQLGVLGVLVEAIDFNAVGVIALASGSAIVSIRATVTPGSIASGDYLVATSVTEGVCRTVGSSLLFSAGTPKGAFAVAIEAESGGLVLAELLGYQGDGAWVDIDQETIPFTTPDGAFHDEDISGAATSTKHLPILYSEGDIETQVPAGAGTPTISYSDATTGLGASVAQTWTVIDDNGINHNTHFTLKTSSGTTDTTSELTFSLVSTSVTWTTAQFKIRRYMF